MIFKCALFRLGTYFGKVTRENGWFYGVTMLTVIALATLMIFLVQRFLSVQRRSKWAEKP
jgi:flagellar biogenesis protein FliO